ncbi:MAG: hypothetical protein AB7P49_03165 [Bdellovibrionales bacterium]
MKSRARPVDITRLELYLFPAITLVVTAALAVLYTKYESATTATSICITLFLFAAETTLQKTMPENFQVPLLPIWVVLTMWLLYGTEAPENHFHSIGEMTIRDLIWTGVVVAQCFKKMTGNNLHILRGVMVVLIAVSLFLPTEASVATLMPPWALFAKVGVTICVYMTMHIRARIRPHGRSGDLEMITHDVIFQSISPLFLHMAFLFVPVGLLVHIIWSSMNLARSRAPREMKTDDIQPQTTTDGTDGLYDQSKEDEDSYMYTQLTPPQPLEPTQHLSYLATTWASQNRSSLNDPINRHYLPKTSASPSWGFVE